MGRIIAHTRPRKGKKPALRRHIISNSNMEYIRLVAPSLFPGPANYGRWLWVPTIHPYWTADASRLYDWSESAIGRIRDSATERSRVFLHASAVASLKDDISHFLSSEDFFFVVITVVHLLDGFLGTGPKRDRCELKKKRAIKRGQPVPTEKYGSAQS